MRVEGGGLVYARVVGGTGAAGGGGGGNWNGRLRDMDMIELTCVDLASGKNPGGLLGEITAPQQSSSSSTASSSAGGGKNVNNPGMVIPLSLPFCRRLMQKRQKEDGGIGVLEYLGGEKVGWRVEVAVGRNGRGWVWAEGGSGSGDKGGRGGAGGTGGRKTGDDAGVRYTLAVARILQEVDRTGAGLEEQEKIARRVVRELGGLNLIFF